MDNLIKSVGFSTICTYSARNKVEALYYLSKRQNILICVEYKNKYIRTKYYEKVGTDFNLI